LEGFTENPPPFFNPFKRERTFSITTVFMGKKKLEQKIQRKTLKGKSCGGKKKTTAGNPFHELAALTKLSPSGK